MKSDELQRVRTSVLSSPLLSQSEKAEWVQLLPSMNDVQVAELMEILSSAKPVATQPAPAAPVSAPTPAPVKPRQTFHLPDLNEKDLPAPHIPLDLPAAKPAVVGASLEQILKMEKPPQPAQPVQPIQPVAAPPKPPVNPMLQAVRPAPQPAPNHISMSSVISDARYAEQQQQTAAAKASRIPQPTAPAAANEHIIVSKPDDLTKLTPGYLHDEDPQLVLAQLLKVVSEFTKKYKFTDLVGKVEQSPLYQAYFALGMALLNDSSTDRESVYQNFQRNAAAHGEGSLSKEEFEAFTDFRRALDRILV